jgi:hypothetical protein
MYDIKNFFIQLFSKFTYFKLDLPLEGVGVGVGVIVK